MAKISWGIKLTTLFSGQSSDDFLNECFVKRNDFA